MSANEYLAPTSELEAVNLCLAAIGESPVDTLEDPTSVSDVELAAQKVREVSRHFQSRGWSFNSQTEFLITRESDGRIPVPFTALHIDLSRCEYGRGVRRGRYLFNLESNSFEWPRDVRVDLKLLLPFNDLPESARYYIAVRASRLFARQAMGAGATEQYTNDDERRALATFRRDELRSAGNVNLARHFSQQRRI